MKSSARRTGDQQSINERECVRLGRFPGRLGFRCFLMLAVLFVPYGKATADLIVIEAKGTFGALWAGGGPSQLIREDDAWFKFSYDLTLAPSVANPTGCDREIGLRDCIYSYDEPGSGGSEIDDVTWLSAEFDFGEFEGYLVPGTATWQYLNLDERAGWIEVSARGDWQTSSGSLWTNNPSGIVTDGILMQLRLDDFDPLTLDQSAFGTSGVVLLDKFGLAEGWMTVESFHIYSVPEPGTLGLLSIGLAGIGFARRRRKD